MRHGKKLAKLGRTTPERKQLFRNLVAALIRHERIETTLAKAKALQPIAEKMITLGKKNTKASKISAWSFLYQEKAIVPKLFKVLATRYAGRSGGYTRIIRTPSRRVDSAKMAIIEYVDNELPSLKPPESSNKKLSKKMLHADDIKNWFKQKKLIGKQEIWDQSQTLPYPKPSKPPEFAKQLINDQTDILAKMTAELKLHAKIKQTEKTLSKDVLD